MSIYIYIYMGLWWPPAASYNCAQVRHHSPAGTFTRVPGRCLRWSPTPPGPRWSPAYRYIKYKKFYVYSDGTHTHHTHTHPQHTHHTRTTHAPHTHHTRTRHAPDTHQTRTRHAPDTHQTRTRHAPDTHQTRTRHAPDTHQTQRHTETHRHTDTQTSPLPPPCGSQVFSRELGCPLIGFTFAFAPLPDFECRCRWIIYFTWIVHLQHFLFDFLILILAFCQRCSPRRLLTGSHCKFTCGYTFWFSPIWTGTWDWLI